MLRVQTEKNGVVRLKHFRAIEKHVKMLTEIVRDDCMKNMSLSCEDEAGRPFSVQAFHVNVDPKELRQMNLELK